MSGEHSPADGNGVGGSAEPVASAVRTATSATASLPHPSPASAGGSSARAGLAAAERALPTAQEASAGALLPPSAARGALPSSGPLSSVPLADADACAAPAAPPPPPLPPPPAAAPAPPAAPPESPATVASQLLTAASAPQPPGAAAAAAMAAPVAAAPPPLPPRPGHGPAALWTRLEALVDKAVDKLAPSRGPSRPTAAQVEEAMYSAGGVFGIPASTKYHDTVWQIDPPRMLRYKPAVLHSWGWVPLLIPRNFKGTVLCDPHVWCHVAAMWLWMGLIWGTALGADPRDARAFVTFFGAPYMAAILNLCMVITFTLGLFVTLVINRWWDIRVNYGAARSLSIELAYAVSTNLRGAKGPAGEAPELSAAQNGHARCELVRYLNFAHLLLLCDAQKAEGGDFGESPLSRAARGVRARLAAVPVLRHLLALEVGLDSGVSALGDMVGNPRSLLRSLQSVSTGLVTGVVKGVVGAVQDVRSAVKAVGTGRLEMADLGLEALLAERAAAAAKLSTAREVDFQQFYVMGLVTPDEWALIRAAERDGIPSWRTVYNWAAALMADATAAGRVVERVATAGGMQAMCMEIRNAGGRVFTMMNTQLPFTYVHLVSFIVHAYMFVIATYFGFVLNAGIPGVRWDILIAVPGQADALAAGQLVQHYKPGSIRDGDGPLMTFYLFFIIGFVATILQGLLSMHSLLENPFGTHPCKFPLRFYNIDHIRQTRAMLREPALREPSSVRNMFAPKQQPQPAQQQQQQQQGGAGGGEGGGGGGGGDGNGGGGGGVAAASEVTLGSWLPPPPDAQPHNGAAAAVGGAGGTGNGGGPGDGEPAAAAAGAGGPAGAASPGVDTGRAGNIYFVEGKASQLHTEVPASSSQASVG